jgi:hypothetical protein
MNTVTIPAHLREFLIATAACDLFTAADTIHSGTLSAYPFPLIDGPADADEFAKFEAARHDWRAADRVIDQLSSVTSDDVTLDADVAHRLIEASIYELRQSLDQMATASPDELIHAAEMLRDLEALATTKTEA